MIIALVPSAVAILLACGLVFGVLGRYFACNPAHRVFFSKSIATDLVYCVLGVFYVGLVPIAVTLLCNVLFTSDAPRVLATINGGYGWLSRRAVGLQIAFLLVVTDFCQYWLHRGFHSAHLWRFHAIHHSAEEVNWTTGFRVHPVNYLLTNTLLAICGRLLGLSREVYLLATPLIFLSIVLEHANLKWTFGPLRYFLVSPVFHRWHHTMAAETRDANFATMFSIWDVVFGTYQMPRGHLPDRYGATGVPKTILGQVLYPFHRASEEGTPALSSQADERLITLKSATRLKVE
jgi:sterol desaturase/sphingolipid hydroxylase (fatty acid hydroxylase superfamily)